MKKYEYECSKCGNRVVLHVEPIGPPTCSKHTGGGNAMTLKSSNKPKYMERGK